MCKCPSSWHLDSGLCLSDEARERYLRERGLRISKLIVVTGNRNYAHTDLVNAGIQAGVHDRRLIWITEEYDIHRSYGLSRETPWVYLGHNMRGIGSVAHELTCRFGEPKALDWVAANW